MLIRLLSLISVSNVDAFATSLLQCENRVAVLERVIFFLQGKILNSFLRILAKVLIRICKYTYANEGMDGRILMI